MHEILEFVVKYCSFLWRGARYRIIDSAVSSSFGGDAYLTISSDEVRIRFVRDRGQLFLDLQPANPDKREWYSIDLVRRLITGERLDSAELDAGYANFLRDSFAEIESRFADPERFPSTEAELRKLKRKRSREMFG
jgi:hypothetical protein